MPGRFRLRRARVPVLLVATAVATAAITIPAPPAAHAELPHSRYCEGTPVRRCVEVRETYVSDDIRKVRFRVLITDRWADDVNYSIAFSKIILPAAGGGTRTLTDYDGWWDHLDSFYTPYSTCRPGPLGAKITYTAYFKWKNAAGKVTTDPIERTVQVCGLEPA